MDLQDLLTFLHESMNLLLYSIVLPAKTYTCLSSDFVGKYNCRLISL